MFTQVLGIMTSRLIMSRSEERPFVLLHSQAIFSHSTVGRGSSRLESMMLSPSKNISHEDVILPELLSDNLSDVLRIFLITVSVTAMILREKEKLCAQNKVQWKSNKLQGK
jgi:hypothetical protein